MSSSDSDSTKIAPTLSAQEAISSEDSSDESLFSARSGISSLSSSSFWTTTSDSSLSSIETRPEPAPHRQKKQPLPGKNRHKGKVEALPHMANPLSHFSLKKGNRFNEKTYLKNKKFYDNLFEKFPQVPKKITVNKDANVLNNLSQEKKASKENATLEEMKKAIYQRRICQNLDVPWNNDVFAMYHLDRDDWYRITAAWKTDLLSKELMFGAIMTENDYRRIYLKDKKRLLVIFHPDKNRLTKSEQLYTIIFQKINKLYNNYQKINNK